MAESRDVPVYLFTGFLEAGKTKFIQETLEDKRFNTGEKTLLLICEEGIEEYAPDQFAADGVQIRTLETEADLNENNLVKFLNETKAERVVIEYNGMWMLDSLYSAMPQNWMVYQEFMFADATTFLAYNANMRQLVYDKLKSAELVVFNRFKEGTDPMPFHKIVRGASRRADIAYEDPSGNVKYDDIEDPLPFDLNAPVVNIEDEDFAVWYRDMSEEPEKYEDKTFRFRCRALQRKKLPSGTFVVGRHVMTCCVQDIQFAGLVCQYDKAKEIPDDSWIDLTAKCNFKFEAPKEEVATFY